MLRFLIVLSLLIFHTSHSQVNNSKRLDSLLFASKEKKGDTLISLLNEISWEFKNSNLDSAFHYARKAIRLSKGNNNKKQLAYCYNSLANCFEANGKLDSALVYHDKSLRLKLEIEDTIGQADSYNNLGIIYDEKGDYSKALENYFLALKIYESEDATFDKVPMVLSNIGIVYKKQKEYSKTLGYYKKALSIYEENNYEFGIVITSGNIGSVLLSLKAYDSSLVYSEKAKMLYKSMGYNRYVPYMLHNMAVAKDSLKRHSEAQKDFKEAEDYYEKDGNLYELTSVKLGLAKSYLNEGEFNRALRKANQGLAISKTKEYKEFQVRAYKVLSEAYASKGEYKQAFFFSEKYRLGNEDIFEKDKTKVVFELETKYETEKKEKEILTQRAELAEKELNINRKNIQLVGLGLVALLLTVLGYLLYNQQKLKNRQLQKEAELKAALVRIETQNKLQEQRLRISRDLHDNIGAQLTFIISSIENLQYGFKIKNDKLNDKLKGISSFTKETIYELRDTIWAMNKSEISLEDLQVRISNFVEKANVYADNMSFNFLVDDNVSKTLVFTSVKGMNLYRIVQEAINNAIKYANANHVDVIISNENQKLKIVVSDDGGGFDKNAIIEGNGLNNMQKRTQDIGATIAINTAIEKGTQIIIEVDA